MPSAFFCPISTSRRLARVIPVPKPLDPGCYYIAPVNRIPCMTLQAYCPQCEKTVSVMTMLSDAGVKSALDAGAGIRVMHVISAGDHIWSLSEQECEKLRNMLPRG